MRSCRRRHEACWPPARDPDQWRRRRGDGDGRPGQASRRTWPNCRRNHRRPGRRAARRPWSKGNPSISSATPGRRRYAAAIEVVLRRSGGRRGAGDELPDGGRLLHWAAADVSVPAGHRRRSDPRPGAHLLARRADRRAGPSCSAAARYPPSGRLRRGDQGFTLSGRVHARISAAGRSPRTARVTAPPDRAAVRALIDRLHRRGADGAGGEDAKAVLAAYGVPTRPHRRWTCRGVGSRSPSGADFRLAVASKIRSPDIPHKSDVRGGVAPHRRRRRQAAADVMARVVAQTGPRRGSGLHCGGHGPPARRYTN